MNIFERVEAVLKRERQREGGRRRRRRRRYPPKRAMGKSNGELF